MKNIYIIGPLAAGKSTIGKSLAQKLGYDWVDTDKKISERSGVEISWIFDKEGEAGFRKRETELLFEFSQRKNFVISTGGGTILAPENRELMSKEGIVIYLSVSINKQVERTEKDRIRPLLIGTDKKQKLIELAEQRNELYSSIAHIELLTDTSSIPLLVDKLQKKVLDWIESND